MTFFKGVWNASSKGHSIYSNVYRETLIQSPNKLTHRDPRRWLFGHFFQADILEQYFETASWVYCVVLAPLTRLHKYKLSTTCRSDSTGGLSRGNSIFAA